MNINYKSEKYCKRLKFHFLSYEDSNGTLKTINTDSKFDNYFSCQLQYDYEKMESEAKRIKMVRGFRKTVFVLCSVFI